MSEPTEAQAPEQEFMTAQPIDGALLAQHDAPHSTTGTATVKTGGNVCLIEHHLGKEPQSVCIDVAPDEDGTTAYHWLTSVTDQTVQVNFEQPVKVDTKVNWTVTA